MKKVFLKTVKILVISLAIASFFTNCVRILDPTGPDDFSEPMGINESFYQSENRVIHAFLVVPRSIYDVEEGNFDRDMSENGWIILSGTLLFFFYTYIAWMIGEDARIKKVAIILLWVQSAYWGLVFLWDIIQWTRGYDLLTSI